MSLPLSTSSRVLEMDAVRGAAMIAVCLSHSADLMAGRWTSALGTDLVFIGMIATPTFLLLSGTVCGYMSRLGTESLQQFRWRLIDRGLFLLTIAHLVLSLTHMLWMRSASSLSSFFITDAVGAALVASAFIAPKMSPRALASSGVLLYLSSWIISSTATPSNSVTRLAIRLLVGINNDAEPDEGYIVPLLPYLALFAIGLAAGIEYGRLSRRGFTRKDAARFCLKFGALCLVAVLALKALRLALSAYESGVFAHLIRSSASLEQKIPPSPAYILAFGGAGILMSGFLALPGGFAERSGLVRALAVLGRASLVIYIVEYWFFFFPVRVFGWSGTQALWYLITPASIGVLWLLAFCWDKCRWNRFITLGLRKRGSAVKEDAENLSTLAAPP